MPRKTGEQPRDALESLPASMRPRPDAAENPGHPLTLASQEDLASMRPRPDAAENRRKRERRGRGRLASMRPRPDAAENLAGGLLDLQQAAAGFNEAAARCRGKP